jgi:TetR/AcrR family transcriptional regulator, fatty acid metabolism regulator protein
VAYRTTPKVAKRKEAHRARLLQAAISLFGDRGYHATTVPQIVRASASSTGAFYFYFRNKEDVFAAALEAIGQQMAGALNRAIAGAGEDTLRQMKAAVESLIVFLAGNPLEAHILIVESSGLTPRLAGVRHAIVASHCRSVERALASLARLPDGTDPKVAASCWVGAVHESVYQWLQTGKEQRISSEALAREISSFNLRAIGAEKEVP